MATQVWEVLLKFEPARKVYERIYSRTITRREREIAKNVTCLLLWLEMIVGIKVLDYVAEMPRESTKLSRVIDEVDAVHSYVLGGTYCLPWELEHLPTIMGLCHRGRLVDFSFFKFHKDLISRGLAMIGDTIAPLIFNDRLYDKLRWFQEEVQMSAVNPMPARELLEPIDIQRRTPAVDSRTYGLHFLPTRPPLSSQEIKDYFELCLGFGHCIESIAMEQPSRETPRPKHGIIVFRSAQMRNNAMCKEMAIFFRVPNGNDMWVQRYKPLC